jgi:aryl-alcohol dehydrogenase-like predicted oxidoreductase
MTDAFNAASRKATRSYFEKNTLGSTPVRLGKTQWSVSPVGFGGYRISDESPAHREALTEALLSGCNLLDTSTNYGNGASERLIGEVLSALIAEKKLDRGEIVVVSKAGYVQGDNLKLARERAARGIPFPEMVEYSNDCWHCISPEFLKDQITRSLSRLKLETLDVLLLHNPEYFLKASDSPHSHELYYQRIEKAFAYLETEVKAGRIQYYGISSNTFPEAKSSPDYTSLEVVTELAEKLGSDHHFAVVQFPFNLYEPGAALEENNQGKTVAEYARGKDLGTLVNRPLNAFFGESMIRLAPPMRARISWATSRLP